MHERAVNRGLNVLYAWTRLEKQTSGCDRHPERALKLDHSQRSSQDMRSYWSIGWPMPRYFNAGLRHWSSLAAAENLLTTSVFMFMFRLLNQWGKNHRGQPFFWPGEAKLHLNHISSEISWLDRFLFYDQKLLSVVTHNINWTCFARKVKCFHSLFCTRQVHIYTWHAHCVTCKFCQSLFIVIIHPFLKRWESSPIPHDRISIFRLAILFI